MATNLLIFSAALLMASSTMALDQYTPDQADWSTFYSKPFAGDSSNTAHDPDGVGWISAETWADSEWDGVTIYNPSKMTKDEFSAAICPGVDRIRGIREVFYRHNPFADVNNPTKAEVDEWHRIALNHARALIGYTSPDRQAKPDICMHARSLWGQQRRFTTMWDTAYPGTVGSAAGPCQGSSNAHCGATFIPSAEDQAPYLPAGHPACGTPGGSEGVFGGPKSNIPWSLKWSRGLCNTLMAEGFWGGHVGPFFHREKFGFSFWDQDPNNNNNNAILRAKWTGALMPNLYCNPSSDPDCDPNNTGPILDPCALRLSWPEVDAVEGAGTKVFTGGLGTQMNVGGPFLAWLCIEPTGYCQDASGSDGDLACFKFHEDDEYFVWFGWNSVLRIVSAEAYPGPAA